MSFEPITQVGSAINSPTGIGIEQQQVI
jgi:hypothetical protein